MGLNRFFRDKANETVLVDYPLNENSVVFEIGGYLGNWSEMINNRYRCKLFIFEPVTSFYDQLIHRFKDKENVRIFNYGILNKNCRLPISVCKDGSSFFNTGEVKQEAEIRRIDDVMNSLSINNVDLVQINAEGSEYDLLDYILSHSIVSMFTCIQIQFHNNIPKAEERRNKIIGELHKTHDRLFNYELVFESWKLKIQGEDETCS